MPQAIPLILGYVTTGLLEAAGAYVFASVVIGAAVTYGTTKLLGLDEPPKVAAPGIKGTVRGTVAPIPIVYGKRRVGGVLAQAVTSGNVLSSVGTPTDSPGRGTIPKLDTSQTDNKFLNFVVCWCEGEIEGVENLYYTDDLSTSSTFDGFTYEEHFTGTDDQVACQTFLDALSYTYEPTTAASLWSTEHRLLGIAYSYIKLTYNVKAWATGIPQISAEVKGKKLYDPRTGLTAWSDNPALCLYDYLTSTRYGRGIDASELDTQSFIDAANYCDQEIFIQTGGDGISEPIVGVVQARYTCDAVLNPDDSLLENVRVLLGTCRGSLVWSGGLYQLKLDKPEVPTFALTEDNIVGGWGIQLESSETRFNRVTVQWVNRLNKYQPDKAVLDSAAYRAADNNEVLEVEVDLPATCNLYQPLVHAGMILRQSRYSLAVDVTCTLEALAVEVFDVVTVTHEVPGWSGQTFRVMAVELLPDDHVKLQLRQYADDVYDLDSQNEADSPPPSSLPDPRVVSAIELFEAGRFATPNGDGTNRYYYRLAWGTLVDNAHLRGFNIRWRETGETYWHSTVVPYNYIDFGTAPGRLHYFDLYVVPETPHEVEVEAFNSLGVRGAVTAASLFGIEIP